MLRVLQIVDNLFLDSGTTSVVMNIYRNIDRDLVQFDFLVLQKTCDRGNSYEEEIMKMGGNVFFVCSPLTLKTYFKSQKQVKKFFKEYSFKYKIAHLHTPTLLDFSLKFARNNGIKHRIIHSHSTMTSTFIVKKILNQFLLRNIFKWANHFWSCSTEAAHFLYGRNFNKFNLIKNAVDFNRFGFDECRRQLMRNEYGLEKNKVFVHISNFSAIKNVLFLADVIKEMSFCSENFRFIFVGDGSTRVALEKKLNEMKVSHLCVFVGRRNSVNDYLNMSDALVLPSIKEGLPVTVVEAQASGLPCFISSSITREVNAGLVNFVDLNVGMWQKALDCFEPLENLTRKRFSLDNSKTVFNIRNEARRVCQTYLSMVEND